jgi:hypothetical protein
VLRFFRINDPYRLLGVLIILVLAGLPFFIDPANLTIAELKGFVLGEAVADGKTMYTEVFDDTAPLASLFFGGMSFIFGRSVFAWHLIAFLIIFFQASYFAVTLINNKAYEENTYLPALIYGVLAFFSFDLFAFSNELIASTFVLFAINNLFKEIEFRVQRDEIVLNVGLMLGLSSLIIFSYILFLPAVIFLLAIFARLNIRKVFLLLFGFLLPHGILIMLYFYRDGATLLWQNFYSPNLSFSKHGLISWSSLFTLCIIPLSYLLFSFVMLNRVARFTRYQSQLLQVMFIWLVPCCLLIVFTRELSPHSFYVFLPILSYFIAHYLLLIRRKWIAEGLLWFFMGGVLCLCLFARYKKISRIDYSNMFVAPSKDNIKDKKIMSLGNDINHYQYNTMSGGFLNWNLSKQVFEQPDYYENILMINNAFKSDPPDIIIDEKNLMEAVMKRIPSLRNQYRRQGTQYIKISN